MLCMIPAMLSAQEREDISVEMNFNKPNEFICKIRNMTEHQITILLSKEAAEGHSNIFFDSVRLGKDTARIITDFIHGNRVKQYFRQHHQSIF